MDIEVSSADDGCLLNRREVATVKRKVLIGMLTNSKVVFLDVDVIMASPIEDL